MEQRENIILNPGPIHLFWTTGVFYLYELKNKHNIVLFVDEDTYRANKKFEVIVEKFGVRDIVYFSQKGILSASHRLSGLAKKIITEFQPKVIYQHNENYVQNMYLIYWARELVSDCKVVVFQNGRMALEWQKDFEARIALQKKEFQDRWKIVPKEVVKHIIAFKNTFKYILKYQILPYLDIGKSLLPRINVFSGRTYPEHKCIIDCFYYYLPEERLYFDKIYEYGERFVLRNHPSLGLPQESIKVIYDDDMEICNRILLLPSYGYMETCIENGERREDVVKRVTEGWQKVLKAVGRHLDDYEVIVKLHPRTQNSFLWSEVLTGIQSKYSIKILNTNESAEKWILKSKVIIGDMSSALWWASFSKSRCVISLDIFGYENGDEGKYYENILYVNSERELDFQMKRAKESNSAV